MKLNVNIVVLTFIIVIVVVYLTENLMMTALTLSLMINLTVLYNKIDDFKELILPASSTSAPADLEVPAVDVVDPEADLGEYEPYGRDYERWDEQRREYTDCYPEIGPINAYDCTENTSGIDAANALMVRRRTRDKKAMDGAATKTADYYRYHFSKELDDAEARVWWGRAEI